MTDPNGPDYALRHRRFGWWALLCFLTLGIILEALHGFKVGWYLDVANEARRLTWTLAHAHGTLLGLIHLGFAWSLTSVAVASERRRSAASLCLIAASVLLPGGFFLGGLVVHAGDPGLGVLLSPVGGALLFCAVVLVALEVSAKGASAARAEGQRTRR